MGAFQAHESVEADERRLVLVADAAVEVEGERVQLHHLAAVARAARAKPAAAQRRRTDVPQELEQDSPARAHELPLVGCGVAEQEIWCGRRDVLQQEGVDRTR